MTLRGVLIACVVLALTAGAALATRTPATTDGPGRHEIRMRGNSFAPRTRELTLGDTVVWVNTDIVRHDAVRPDLFDSGELKSGERFAWVPPDTGTIRYECTIHERMRGTLRVRLPK